MDEIRVSKIAPYDTAVTPLRRFDPDANTLALYHCDEGSGQTLNDTSGNRYYVTISAANCVEVGP